jgi:hypothetical protein
MSKSNQPARSVRDIKTLAGKADDANLPHKIYMRLFALETERHRRGQERASAMSRLDIIDARCAEIDRETKELLDLLGVESIADLPSGATRAAAGRAKARGSDIKRGPGGNPAKGVTVETPASEPVKIRY